MVRPVQVSLGLYNYSNVLQAFGGKLPSNFFALFPKIRELVVIRELDHQRLFDFLAGCRTLRKLWLFYCEFSPHFYRRLTHLKPLLESLEYLTINEKKIKLNLAFLLLMKNLESFWLCLAERANCERRPGDQVHLQMVVNRYDKAPCGPKLYRLHICNNQTKAFDGPDPDQPPEHLEILVDRLHQHERVQKILN